MTVMNSCTVIIRPIGMLKNYIGGHNEASVPAMQTVRSALTSIGIPPELVALVIVNENQQSKDYVLQEQDVVKVLAVIGGG